MLTQLELHAGREPAAGPAQAAVQGGPESAPGVLGEDDGGAAEAQGTGPRLQGQLAAVAAPRAVGRRHDRLAVGRDRGHRRVEDIVPEVLLRGVLDLRVAAVEGGNGGRMSPGRGRGGRPLLTVPSSGGRGSMNVGRAPLNRTAWALPQGQGQRAVGVCLLVGQESSGSQCDP